MLQKGRGDIMKSSLAIIILLISATIVVAQEQFPTVAVYTACLNKKVGEFDNDMAEGRIKPDKCSLEYPKYCNSMRMAIMEDCVRCKHLPCPAGTYCDPKRRKCKKGEMPPELAALAEKKAAPKTAPAAKLPTQVTIKSSLETVATQQIAIIHLEADTAAAKYLGVSLEQAGAQIDYITNTDVDPNTLGSKHLIIVGGPCANLMWSKLSDETCKTWDFSKKGKIKARRIDGKVGILIAGSTQADTFALSNVLIAQYKKDPKFAQEFSEFSR